MPQDHPMTDPDVAEVETALKAAAARLDEENKVAMRRCADPDGRAEMRAENVGHSVMLREALKIVRQYLNTPSSGER